LHRYEVVTFQENQDLEIVVVERRDQGLFGRVIVF
jgi:hypothetical protein